ncbi:MAG TPA: hypothetical protein PKD86_02335, partial [Gemmatales bacterium]|nr:hypothetical protein [Gemmatales bacterium]
TGINDDQVFTVASVAGGAYSFAARPVGLYRVSTGAGVPGGYGATTPQPIEFLLGPGQTRNDIDFGFQALNSGITGIVFNDFNFNGILDGSDTAFGAGVRVIVDLNGNGIFDAGEPFAFTNAGGVYTIGSLAAGTYTVTVTDSKTAPSCTAQATINITQPAVLNVVVSNVPMPCNGGTASVSSTP